jgi:ABC-2 type transport system ATP-binding protein
MLKCSKLTKRYGSILAVDGLDLNVRAGEIFGFLGPNGAGKSTVVSLAVGLQKPDSGQIEIGDYGSPQDPAVRGIVGVAPQALALYSDLSARENLEFFGQLYGLRGKQLTKQVGWAIDFIDMKERENDPIKSYSGGMKRRVNLAAALLHDPKLILLDEPTVGVDPQSRNSILDRILELKGRGCTVIYTSHYMSEVEKICDRVAIMDKGKLLALGTVGELISKHGGGNRILVDLPNGEESFALNDPNDALRSLARIPDIVSFRTEQPNLETVFLNLTGRSLRDQ